MPVQLGDLFFVPMDCSYPFAYWHYSICRTGLQYPPKGFKFYVFDKFRQLYSLIKFNFQMYSSKFERMIFSTPVGFFFRR